MQQQPQYGAYPPMAGSQPQQQLTSYPQTQYAYAVPVAATAAPAQSNCCSSRLCVLVFLAIIVISAALSLASVPVLLQFPFANSTNAGLMISSAVIILVGSVAAFIPMFKNNVEWIRRTAIGFMFAIVTSVSLNAVAIVMFQQEIAKSMKGQFDSTNPEAELYVDDMIDAQKNTLVAGLIVQICVVLLIAMIIIYNMVAHRKLLIRMQESEVIKA